jgi:hypothetical protein
MDFVRNDLVREPLEGHSIPRAMGTPTTTEKLRKGKESITWRDISGGFSL